VVWLSFSLEIGIDTWQVWDMVGIFGVSSRIGL